MFKYCISACVAVVAFATFSALPLPARANGARVPFIRMYNKSINDHFYTNSRVEADAAAANHGYKLEGEMGYLYAESQSNTEPVYRLWNPKAGKHFYTTSTVEADGAVRSGFAREGVVGYMIAPIYGNADMRVYRLYNAKLQKHFYTTSRAEVDALEKVGYKWEGELGGGVFNSDTGSSSNFPTPTAQADFIMTSSPFAVFTLGVHKSVTFSFQYKGPDGAQPVVTYNGMPAGLSASIISPAKVNNNDSFTFTIFGTLNTNISTTLRATIHSSIGYSEILDISLSTVSQPIQSPTIITTQLPAGIVGQQYSTYIYLSNPSSKVLNGSMANMPDGLSFSGSSFPSATTVVGNTIYLTGTPTRAGSFPAVLTISDGTAVVTQNYNLVINPAIPQPVTLPSSDGWLNLYTDSIPVGTVGVSYTGSINFTRYRGNAVSVTVTGLPSGLSIFGGNVFNLPVGQNGFTIAGTPTSIGTSTVNVTMTDGISTVGRDYALMIGQ